MQTFNVPEGMARSIFENKYARRKPDGTYETWAECAERVVRGNFSLVDVSAGEDFDRTLELAQGGVLPFSGRHLQHGDLNQKHKIGETFTNCSTALFSFTNFWLLLKGSGVGRCYDSDICRVNWDFMPNVRFVLEGPDLMGEAGHPDYEPWIETAQEARHKYDSESEDVRWFEVEDSAEGWVKVVEVLETAAFQKEHADKLFIFDFSKVRAAGEPIKGQQNRPASGPVPFIRALTEVSRIKGAGMKPWMQSMFIDHHLAACVAVGGIRRSARIAVKSWRDRGIFDFIDIKRGGWLFTANNSVGVDEEFWEQASSPAPSHGRKVFEAMVSAAYFDRTGEPGFLNMHRMSWSNKDLDTIASDTLLSKEGKELLDIHPRTEAMFENVLRFAKKKDYPFLVNPCSEILLAAWGGYCTIADICLANVTELDQALDAARLATQFLMRTNTMPFLYEAEVKRTNRIGVSLTGIHEFAAKHFGLSFRNLLDEDKSGAFWKFIAQMRQAAEAEARRYAEVLGVNVPHTITTMKPSGTISKVMACTEGGHLPAYDYYMRWVQYPKNDPAVKAHEERGYPIKDVSHQYTDHVVIGFPTRMSITRYLNGSLVLAGDATPREQYGWIQLLEEHWLGPQSNNQISYTLKYDPERVGYEDFMRIVLEQQRKVRCCAVMPQEDLSAYAYLPEERISRTVYEDAISRIERFESEVYDETALSCEGGACPIEPNANFLVEDTPPPVEDANTVMLMDRMD